MPSLRKTDDRFGTMLSLIEGGSGVFQGIITEPGQGEVPAYLFNLPRRILRVDAATPVREGMVVRAHSGTVWMLGKHGDSETMFGSTFRSLRMFEAEGRFKWKRRGKKIDPVTKLPLDSGLVDQPDVWGAYEPAPEMFDRQVRVGFETGRFITPADIQLNDEVDGMKVARVDLQLGLRLVTLG